MLIHINPNKEESEEKPEEIQTSEEESAEVEEPAVTEETAVSKEEEQPEETTGFTAENQPEETTAFVTEEQPEEIADFAAEETSAFKMEEQPEETEPETAFAQEDSAEEKPEKEVISAGNLPNNKKREVFTREETYEKFSGEEEKPKPDKEGLEHMKLSEREAAVEAILFAAGNPVEIDSIAAVIGEDKATAESLAESLVIKYKAEKRGINVIRINDSYQMCTNRIFYNYIDKLFKQPKRKNMSQAILEVLAIIAYKQPVTKTEIEEIRGINSDRMVNKLVEYDLVCEKGRKKVPGRPILFGTTDEFLRVFGYSSTDALPEFKTPDARDFDEAAKEAAEKLKQQ
ncbi:MAG: SMC-Scp complex subunit ScpB [Clostridiales bacterium]|nr:SMC-Scp complex subunit ScpB [Clostridiales bacterium]